MRSFGTPDGRVEMMAQAIIQGDLLILDEIAVFPAGPARLSIGTAELWGLFGQLRAEFRGMGFRRLRIVGTRLSGANPGRRVDITINL